MYKTTPKRLQPTIKDPNRICVICNQPYVAKSPLQKTCSVECRGVNNATRHKRFKEKNPDAMSGYNKNRIQKDPDYWRKKVEKERVRVLEALGGKCVVCGVTNKNWLHVDYIPTMAGTGMRHPRHPKWVIEHKDDFRILCANHHYELTITGKIEGSDIVQHAKQAYYKKKNEYNNPSE